MLGLLPFGFAAEAPRRPISRPPPRTPEFHQPRPQPPTPVITPSMIPGYAQMTDAEQLEAMQLFMDQAIEAQRRGVEMVYPTYTADSPLVEFLKLDVEERVRLQRDLATHGLLDEYRAGQFDRGTRGAMETVMGWANATGTDWRQALVSIGREGLVEQVSNNPAFPVPTYLAPDYASLAQHTKRTFRALLNRDPTEAELAGLADELSSHHREAYEALVEAERQDFYAQQEASGGLGVAAHEPGGGEVQEVDWQARFQEAFEERYSNAIDMENREEESLAVVNNFLNGIGVGSRALGGG